MMNAVKKTACALMVLAATSTAVMAESIDVKVIGTITPTACKPILSGDGTLDYGSINPNTLKKDEFTVLDEKQIDFAITCDAPAKVALVARTARGNSAVQKDGSLAEVATAALFGSDKIGAAGLGLDGTKGVGGYGLRLQAGTVQADGNQVDSIQANDNPTSWAKTDFGSLYNTATSIRYMSWAKTGSLEPIAFTNLSGKLGAQAYINKASELDLSKPVRLDGLTTLELIYL